jgi:hypothetical protein
MNKRFFIIKGTLAFNVSDRSTANHSLLFNFNQSHDTKNHFNLSRLGYLGEHHDQGVCGEHGAFTTIKTDKRE